MRFKDYAASKGLTVCFIGLAEVLAFVFLLFLGIRMGFILFAEASIALLAAAWLALGYIIQKERFKRLTKIISALSDRYLLGEVLEKPANEHEFMYFEIMKTISSDAIRAVEAARREKDEYGLFVEGWVHEIKTPLTACSLMLENGANVPKLRRELKRADNLTENILYYSRIGRPENDTVIRRVSLAALTDDVLKDQMPLLTAAGISVETDGDFFAFTDDKAVGFILKQLLCNSAKYCPNCHISIRLSDGVIVYEDDGIGIPACDLPRVTRRGFTGTNGRKQGGSTGMGLFLAKELCGHLNISMKIESEQGKYTRFALSFDSLTKP